MTTGAYRWLRSPPTGRSATRSSSAMSTRGPFYPATSTARIRIEVPTTCCSGSTTWSATCNWGRSEEHTSELQSRGLISYAVFCLKKKKDSHKHHFSHLLQRHGWYVFIVDIT